MFVYVDVYRKEQGEWCKVSMCINSRYVISIVPRTDEDGMEYANLIMSKPVGVNFCIYDGVGGYNVKTAEDWGKVCAYFDAAHYGV